MVDDDQDGGRDMAKDTKLTIMVDEPLIDQLGRAAFDADVTKSDLVRACIHVGPPPPQKYSFPDPHCSHASEQMEQDKRRIITR